MQRSCIITDSHNDVHVVCWTESVLADTMRWAILRSLDRRNHRPSLQHPPLPIFAHTLSRQLPSAKIGKRMVDRTCNLTETPARSRLHDAHYLLGASGDKPKDEGDETGNENAHLCVFSVIDR